MRAACPTPVSVIEEAPPPRSVGTSRTPVYARTRVSKGFTIRKPSLCYPEGRETPLSPSTNLQGTSVLQGKLRSRPQCLRQQSTPRAPLPTVRLEEVPMIISRDNSESCDWGSVTESEFEGDDPMHSLSVTGRNPATSDSNVTDCHNVRLPELHLPSKTRSAVQQSRIGKSSRRYSLTPLPVNPLNVGGLGLPFPTEPPCTSGKDYKPGRVVHTSFDCFRCEHRMSVHDNHQWLKSILISSRLRKTRKLPSDNRYSKGDLSLALFPRYWSNQYLEPEPDVQVKTPDTRPMTQTPDTVSGPWRGDNSRCISIINGQLTREDLEGFCGKGSCQSMMDGKDQPTPFRPYKSDTHLGANVMTYGDVWCHSADVKDDLMSRQNSRVSENGVRETTSMASQCDKTSRLSVYSREGLSRGRSSDFETTMRIHCETPEDVYLELHEEANTDEGNYQEESDEMHAVRVDYSLKPTQESHWNHSLCWEEMLGQEEDYPDQDQRCFSLASRTPSWCFSRSSVVSEGYQKSSPCDFYDASVAECFEPSGSNWNGLPLKRGTFSQIDCNTSAVERCPTLQGRRKKSPQGQRNLYASPINSQLNFEEEGFLPHHHWQHSVSGMKNTFDDEPPGAGARYLDNNLMLGLSDLHQELQPELYNEEEEEEDDDGEEEDEDHDKMLQNPHSQFLLKMRQEMDSRYTEQPYPELPKPLGKYFCYAPIVDKRYNRWKRRKPKKRKRVAVKVHTYDSKTSTSTSNESTAVPEEETNGRELKKGKHYRRDGARFRERKAAQKSTDDTHPQEVLDTKVQIRVDPVVDQSDSTSADETQFPDSTEACSDSSKSSLTSRSSGSHGLEPRLRESFIIPTPVTFLDMDDMSPSPTKEPSSPEMEYRRPEPIIEQARARSRVASIPSKNYPRTQKSLLSLSLRGPTLEKEMSKMDPMQALPRAGGRLPLLKTQREELARSADRMSHIPSNTSCLSKMQRRLGWIKRGILQQNSNKDLKLSAEKYVLSSPRQSPVSRPQVTKSKLKSAIPRHTKASCVEKFCTVVQGQKKLGSAQKKPADRYSSGQVTDRENDTEENPTFTLKDLLATLPDSESDLQRTHRKTSPSHRTHRMTNFFTSNFVTGSFLHKRKLNRPQVDRSISTLSFTPAFTFSVYTLPHSYRSRNNHMGGATT
ncbi:uncharacterized protein LOC124270137 [Haliotis rubra]|uniref:uncharacterized protein LOC124270137 n=1 Tax=Haliotis rubra TaxID=36100 RepID=UPI001EE56F88|nr:uncharacterized protein LOC124270137 [Haliotis rubra]